MADEDDEAWKRKLSELFAAALTECGPNAEKMAEFVIAQLPNVDAKIRLRIQEEIRRMLSFQEPPAKPGFEH